MAENMVTRNVTELAVEAETVMHTAYTLLIRHIIEEKKPEIKQVLDSLIELEKKALTPKNENAGLKGGKKWFRIENKKIFFHSYENCLIPDLNRVSVDTRDAYYSIDQYGFPNMEFEGYKGKLFEGDCSYIRSIFFDGNCPFQNTAVLVSYIYSGSYYATSSSSNLNFNRRSGTNYSYCIPNLKQFSNKTRLRDVIIRERLIPSDISSEMRGRLKYIFALLDTGFAKFNGDNFELNIDLLIKSAETDKITKLFGEEISEEAALEYVTEASAQTPLTAEIDEQSFEELKEWYCECDTRRAAIEPYDENMLTDINKGHWELWSTAEQSNITGTLPTPLVGRNPETDVRHDGIIGIDFGTKSTIVAYQDETNITRLLRIGEGDLSKKAEAKHYENPTVMEFSDFDEFIGAYDSSAGRPETNWDDVCVSHTADRHFSENSKDSTDKFYSFFYNLKNWCRDTAGKHSLKLRDDYDTEMIFGRYVDVPEGEFDPIEIYAYYLGLFINNMRNGIYLKYYMSFPVTFELAVREKLIASFSRGLKKSLPKEILDNEELMKEFFVRPGASEPAAYAVCALQQYNICPKKDERVFYGIFDFGGGTTDFDFGIWRAADENNIRERRYAYVISHFGAGGDILLGGENLLDLLAYEVFRFNADRLRGKKAVKAGETDTPGFTFVLPDGCQPFEGSETLIDDSLIAKRNTKQLAEALRVFTENLAPDEKGNIRCVSPDWKGDSEGKLTVTLYDRNGDRQEKELYLSRERDEIPFDRNAAIAAEDSIEIPEDENEKKETLCLYDILEKRIQSGVDNFFLAMSKALDSPTFQKEQDKVSRVCVFFSGNASRSPIVKKLFREFVAKCSDGEVPEFSKIELFPALGTDEAYEKQLEENVKIDRSASAPTCKTGVVYGLIDSRPGSIIKVVNEISSDSEIPFSLYVGINSKGIFDVVMERGAEYGKWVPVLDAAVKDFELFYTSVPEALNQMSVTSPNIKKKLLSIPETSDDENVFIYAKATAPKKIVFAVARESEIASGKTMSGETEVEFA